MSTESERVQIALASDERYYCGLLVTAASMAKRASKDATLVFNILDSGIADETFNAFKVTVTRFHDKSEFVRLRVSQDNFRNYRVWNGSWMTYARLLLSDLLPNVDHVIYCDVDFLWLADIVELWRLRDDQTIMMSTVDPFRMIGAKEGEAKWFRDHGFEFDASRYFCAGLSFYNLRKFREEGMEQKIIDFLNQHPDVSTVDQTAMNILMAGRVRMLPRKWAVFSSDLRPDDLKADVVIHYAGDCPWTRFELTDLAMLWFRYDAMLHGRTVWDSVRAYYPNRRIRLRRFIALLMRHRIGALLLTFYLCARENFGAAMSLHAYHSVFNRRLPGAWKIRI